MKRTKILTESERKQLHEFYYSSAWELLSKILRVQKENIKTSSITSNSMEELSYFKGQLQQVIWLENQLKINSDKVKKGEQNAKEKS